MELHPAGPFTTKLWQSVEDRVQKIVAHPFNQGLASGKLPSSVFRDYLEQDTLYLIEDTRALKQTAKRAPNKSERELLSALARSNVEVELELHALLDRDFPRRPQVTANEATTAYAEFLLRTAETGYQESVAALLPCFWVYQVVGILTAEQALAEQSFSSNPYQSWLDTYSSTEFIVATQSFIDLVETVAKRAENDMLTPMEEAFFTATSHELAFLEGVWRRRLARE